MIDIDRIFYINLDRRPDRDHNMRTQLNKLDQNPNKIERVSAVDGSILNLDTISKDIITPKGISDTKMSTINSRSGVSLTYGAIGCALSHRDIWLKILNDPAIDSALILEDDVMIDPDFVTKYKSYQNQIGKYDVLFLGYHPATIKYLKSINNPVFMTTSKVYGLFGYIITKVGASKLLETFPITNQIDTEIAKILKSELKALLIKPDLRLITSEPSEIATKFGTDIQINKPHSNKTELFPISTSGIDMFSLVMIIVFALLIVLLVNTCIDPKSVEP